jgi:hypothetical protein
MPMPPHLSSGDSASRPVADERLIGSRSRERIPTDLLKLRAQTFEFELKRERQRCLETGESLPAEWVASLEQERQDILDLIQREEAKLEPPPSPPITSTIIHAPKPRPLPLSPITNVEHGTEAFGRSSAPHAFHTTNHTLPRPATTHPIPRLPAQISATRGGGLDHDSPPSSSLGVRKREIGDHSQPGSRSKSSRPLSASKRSQSHPRPFLLPRNSKGADVQATLVDGVGQHFDTSQEPSLDEVIPLSPTRPFTPTPLSPANVYGVRTPTSGESGRRSARGWYPDTPRPAYNKGNLYRQALTPTRAAYEEKLRKVFTEAEGMSYAICRNIPLDSPDFAPLDDPLRAFTESPDQDPTPTTPRPPHSRQPATHDPPDYHTPPTSPPPFPKQFYPYHRGTGTSERSFSPTHTLTDEIIPKSKELSDTPRTGIALQIAKICSSLMDVFRDLAKYKHFLSYRDEAAQHLLNFLQTVCPCLSSPPVMTLISSSNSSWITHNSRSGSEQLFSLLYSASPGSQSWSLTASP